MLRVMTVFDELPNCFHVTGWVGVRRDEPPAWPVKACSVVRKAGLMSQKDDGEVQLL